MSTNQEALKIQAESVGVGVRFRWLGLRKTFTHDEKEEAATVFGASPTAISASKKIFDSKSVPFKRLSKIKLEITRTWKAYSLPYPEEAVRLLKKEEVDIFNNLMKEFEPQFWEAVELLDLALPALKAQSQQELGKLFNSSDYPESIKAFFDFSWSFPALEPPEYLMTFSPKAYDQEKRRLQQMCEQAVAMVREEFVSEFSELIQSVADSLQPGPDGKKPVVRAGAINRLMEVFYQFQNVNVGQSGELDKLIDKTKKLLDGKAEDLKESGAARAKASQAIGQIQQTLKTLVSKPGSRVVAMPAKKPH